MDVIALKSVYTIIIPPIVYWNKFHFIRLVIDLLGQVSRSLLLSSCLDLGSWLVFAIRFLQEIHVRYWWLFFLISSRYLCYDSPGYNLTTQLMSSHNRVTRSDSYMYFILSPGPVNIPRRRGVYGGPNLHHVSDTESWRYPHIQK